MIWMCGMSRSWAKLWSKLERNGRLWKFEGLLADASCGSLGARSIVSEREGEALEVQDRVVHLKEGGEDAD